MKTANIHPLDTDIESPERFTYPFCYEPHSLCIMATDSVRRMLNEHPEWAEEISRGKMFGVLVVENYSEERGFLCAFSGTLGGKSIQPGFVPPVFDLMAPGCYFQKEEAEISNINKLVEGRMLSAERHTLETAQQSIREIAQRQIAQAEKTYREGKIRRDKLRAEHPENTAEMIKESQFQKAELRRQKKMWAEKMAEEERLLKEYDHTTEALKEERKQRSIALQDWLFHQFRFLNANGKEANLLDIFRDTPPPSGAGDCCAPKLLQYAYKHKLHPICMAEFWMGESPKGEIRIQGNYYPACQSKCKPILGWMLQGLNVEPNPMTESYNEIVSRMRIIYEDKNIVVIEKPSGMLSVPGKDNLPSVMSEMQKKYPKATGPMIVHRLDMDTSGLMVVAMDEESYYILQSQFATHAIKKRYTAILEHEMEVGKTGTITLPLCPNPNDRPRQMVNAEYGKKAVTRYQVMANEDGHAIVWLWPETGRTHQLRMHCAHPDGLSNPIFGDRLYGTMADRLHLYAEELEFTHPITEKSLKFSLKK